MMNPHQYEQPQVREWFRQTLAPTAKIFDTLLLAGETYGSDCTNRIGNKESFVCVNYPDPDDPDLNFSFTSYGRVAYYIQHAYGGMVHSFAMVRWFDHFAMANVDTRDKEKNKTLRDAMLLRFPDLHHMDFTESLRSFPIISTAFTKGTTMDDIIPVQRIYCRWMPVAISGDPKHQLACIIPPRTH
jgi:hypothetical protein